MNEKRVATWKSSGFWTLTASVDVVFLTSEIELIVDGYSLTASQSDARGLAAALEAAAAWVDRAKDELMPRAGEAPA